MTKRELLVKENGDIVSREDVVREVLKGLIGIMERGMSEEDFKIFREELDARKAKNPI